jgi:putative aldouronate transport system permease protein
LIASGITENHNKNKKSRFLRQLDIQSMVWPGIIFMVVFNFIPMFGITIAFKNYSPIQGIAGFFDSHWVGFKNFYTFITDSNFLLVLRNTLGINILSLLISFPAPIIFALLLNELRSQRFKRVCQTISYLPYFQSWIIFGGLIITLLSPDTGAVNQFLVGMGIIKEPLFFLGNPNYFWILVVLVNTIKGLGYGAILYLAAIAGVSSEIIEAAIVDGAGRFRRMWHVILPSIMGTIVILLLLTISSLLSTGFDSIWVLQNNLNVSMSETIDTYVYKMGIQHLRFSYAAAVGVFQALMGTLLLLGGNALSHRLTQKGLF